MRAQRGVALITALLVVALVVVAASAMIYQQRLDMRRTANLLQRDQAQLYSQGLENIMYQILVSDDLKKDHWGEPWATTGVILPFEGGVLAPRLIDLESRFNVNNMVLDKGDGRVAHGFDVTRFMNLIAQIQRLANPDVYSEAELETIRDMNGQELANALVDWMDADDNVTFPGGAEDIDYMALEKPYRAANRPMSDISELRLVKGMTPEVFGILKRFVTALPVKQQVNTNTSQREEMPTPINVNTAVNELLGALSTPPGCIKTDSLTRPEPVSMQVLMGGEGEKIEGKSFDSVNSFLSDPAAAGCTFVGGLPKAGSVGAGQQAPEEALAVYSEYFLFHAEVTMPAADGPGVSLDAVIQRLQQKVAKGSQSAVKLDTLARSQSGGQYWQSHAPY